MLSFTTSAIPTPFQPHRDLVDRTEGMKHIETTHEGDKAPPILFCIIAGAFGGAVGDTTMHSLDTVKTRQQGSLYNPKYRRMIPAYFTIFKEEGLLRGLYGGYSAAILGSIPSTATFFGTYEYSKRYMIGNMGINDTVAYFFAGILGDLALSVFYVPLEVLKTRLQLQGRYNNPYTKGCGYNYRSLRDAVLSISRTEGLSALVYGYKETLFRDLPFSALQFAFYEKFRKWAISYNRSDNLPLTLELFTGAAAGALAGTLTTPLDVIKTRIQTATTHTAGSQKHLTHDLTKGRAPFVHRFSTLSALHSIYTTEGIPGVFSGVGPRLIWAGVQSLIMLLLYQVALKNLEESFGSSPGFV